MNNLFALIKVDLRETLDVRKFKENKSKSISFFAFLAIMLCLGLILSVIYNLMFSFLFYEGNVNMVYSTLIMGGFASVLTFSTSVFKCKSIFVGKDYEILRSMPIKKTTIIAAKIINLYIIELIYAAIIMLPNMIINFVFSMDFTYLVFGLLITLLIPALPMVLACLFSLFITLVADRYKFGNVINFILYTILFAAIIFFSFFLNMNTGNSDTEVVDVSAFTDMANHLAWINPTLFLVKLTYVSNYAYILSFVAANLVLFALVVGFIALFLDKVYTAINSFKSNTKYIRKKLESKGQFKTLLLSEYKRFFTSKYYFINSICSGICAIVLSGIMSFMFSKYSSIDGIEEQLDFFKEYAYVGTLFIIFGIGIATPASASISIEGGNFWMIKSFPIDYKKLALAKLLLSVSVLGICSLVSSTLIIVLIQPSIYSCILLFILPLLYVVLTSVLGLLLNLSYYKLKWKNEQECVKNSAGTVISMLLDWVVMIVLSALLIGLSVIHSYLAGLAAVAMLLIAIGVFYSVLMKSVERKIEKIEDF